MSAIPDATDVELWSYGRRLTHLGTTRGDDVAVHFVPLEGQDQQVTYGELERRANQAARLLAEHGVDRDTAVALGLPNTPDHIVARFAAWKLGAMVLPINAKIPAAERQGMIDLLATYRKVVTVGSWHDGQAPSVHGDRFADLDSYDDTPLPDVTAEKAFAIGSGGTTGTPKITLSGGLGVVGMHPDGRPVSPAGLLADLNLRIGSTQMVCTPLYHTSGFGWTLHAILLGNRLVLIEKFDATRTLDAIEKYSVNQTMFVPAVLQRLLEVEDIDQRDLSSYDALAHGGAPCPDWVKRRWIDLVGAENVYEGMGATEPIGSTVVRGDVWLQRPGTVGKPTECDVRILDDDKEELPSGEVGWVYMRPLGAEAPLFTYLGADYGGVTDDGFVSLGDYGWLDDDGYLFIADRRVDMIISGGANIYPAEVEGALTSHPDVREAAVIGVPDDRWGRRVHAVVVARTDGGRGLAERLDAYVRESLMTYKVPKSYEFVSDLPYSEVGKLRRRPLYDTRQGGEIPGEIRLGR